MATIYEALKNAKYNLLDQPNYLGDLIGKEQLSNAVTLIDKGYGLSDDIETLISEHGRIEDVPDKD